jgi:hypothetical protein
VAIFISYRRGQSCSPIAGRIYDRLRGHFGKDDVFFDVDNIPPGEDFRQIIFDAVQRCDVFLAVLGSDYLDHRINSPTDFVRLEIEAALTQRKCVIPLLVTGVALPDPSSLPRGVAPILYKHGVPLDIDRRFEDDVKFLVLSIEGARRRAQEKARAEALDAERAQAERGAAETAKAAQLAAAQAEAERLAREKAKASAQARPVTEPLSGVEEPLARMSSPPESPLRTPPDPLLPARSLFESTEVTEAAPARLRVLSPRLMFGAEFLLDRPSAVIGRTAENDIILNHKSLSRHHAKVVREGDHFFILDLESANGVRVGRHHIVRCELHDGDVIQLGEVRLRFVTGSSAIRGEHQLPVWYPTKTKLAGVSVAAGALAALLYLAFSRPSVSKTPTSAPSEPVAVPGTQSTPVAVAEPTPDEPVAPAQEILAEAKKKAQTEDWTGALSLVAKVLKREPASQNAADLRKAIEAEKGNSEKLVAIKTALGNRDFDAVIARSGEFPVDSMYRSQVVELRRKAEVQFVAAHLDTASAKLALHDCVEARHEAELVLGLGAKNMAASKIIKQCDGLGRKARPSTPSSPEAEGTRSEVEAEKLIKDAQRAEAEKLIKDAQRAEAEKLIKDAQRAEAEKLIKDAQQAWFRGQYSLAIYYAHKALRVDPGLTNAYQIIAVCSCALHDANTAEKALEKLDDRNKMFVKSACKMNGISF